MNPTDPARLWEGIEKAERATPRPWGFQHRRATDAYPAGWQLGSELMECLADLGEGSGECDSAERDALYIVHAANDYPALARAYEEVERELRYEWWVNHGHDYYALYGDDGEMACNACPADFKRQPIPELRELVRAKRLERAVLAAGSATETEQE